MGPRLAILAWCTVQVSLFIRYGRSTALSDNRTLARMQGYWSLVTNGSIRYSPASRQGTIDAYAMDGGCGAGMCCRRSIIGVYACAYMYIYIYIYIYILRHGLLMWLAAWVLSCKLLFVLTVLMFGVASCLLFLVVWLGANTLQGCVSSMTVEHFTSWPQPYNAGCLDFPHQ